MADADTLLALYSGKLPYAVRPPTVVGQQMIALAKGMENYNKKLLTPLCNPLEPTLALTHVERELEVLRNEVTHLVTNGALTKIQSRSLDVNLVGVKVNRENVQRARLAFFAFIQEVNDLIQAGTLPAKEGEKLRDKANRILYRLK